MNNRCRILFGLSAWLLMSCSSQTAVKDFTYFSSTENLPSIEQPQFEDPEEWNLPNGISVLFSRDDEVPMVGGTLYIRGGSLWEGEQEIGITGALGDQMRQGGAGALSADALDRELELLSAHVSASFGAEFGKFSFRCLKSDLDRVIAILADVVRRPRFEANRLEVWRGVALDGMRRRKDDPETIAGIAFPQILYRHSPYGYTLTSAAVRRISVPALREAHQRFVRPHGAVFAVAGDATRAEIAPLIEKHFGDWIDPAPRELAVPQVVRDPAPGIYFVSGPFSQATVFAGHLGVPRLTEDHLAIDLFNQVFGTSGFGSRLMKTVRSDLGLAYVVYGGIFAGTSKGRTFLYLQTKNESVQSALSAAVDEVRRLQKDPPRSEEVEEAQRAASNSFVFNFESPQDILYRRVSMRLLGYPADYDRSYIPGIMALEPQDLQQVAMRRWDLSRPVVVVVGGEDAYPQLERLVADEGGLWPGLPLKRVKFEEALVGEF